MTVSTAAHIVLTIVFTLLTLRTIGWAAIERRHQIIVMPLKKSPAWVAKKHAN
jgi:hypothetical protein